MNISMPILMIAYKDNDLKSNKVKKDIALDLLATILFNQSTDFYKNLYESGKILSAPSVTYEFSKTYAHLLIQVQTNFVEEVTDAITKQIKKAQEEGLNQEDFERAQKSVYGSLIKDYNEVSTIANGIVSDYFKNINSFDYFEEFNSVNKEYVEKILKELLVEENKVVSVINPINNQK